MTNWAMVIFVISCVCVSVTEPPAVEKTEVQSHNGQLFLSWKPPNRTVSEYVVEWVSDGERNWQRENGKTSYAAIKGIFSVFLRV